MGHPFEIPPAYAITSVDNALRITAMLQLEGPVSKVAQRIGVALSTAHRLLQMLVYRDFAVQEPDRSYRVGAAARIRGPLAVRGLAHAPPHLRTYTASPNPAT